MLYKQLYYIKQQIVATNIGRIMLNTFTMCNAEIYDNATTPACR